MRNAIDFRTKSRIIKRPDKHALFIFDFDFRKNGSDWHYLDSANQLSDFKQQISTTLKHGGQYRIIEVKTGRIVKSNR